MQHVLTALLAGTIITGVVGLDAFAGPKLDEYVYHGNGKYSPKGRPGPESGAGSGNLEVRGGYGLDHEGDDDGLNWGLRGSHNFTVLRNINIQADISYQRAVVNKSTQSNAILGGHLFWRNPNSFAAGVFYQSNKPGLFETKGGGDVKGAEFAVFANNVTLLGQVGFGDEGDSEFIVGKGGLRIYARDDLRFDIDTSVTYEEPTATSDIFATEIGAKLNYRLPNEPVTIFGGVRYSMATLSSGLVETDSSNTQAFVGAKLHYGTDSLKEEERHGVLWDPVYGWFE